MSNGKSMSMAAKLFTGGAVCFMLSIGLCGGGLAYSSNTSKLIAFAFVGGLGFLALAVVLAVVAFIVLLVQGPR